MPGPPKNSASLLRARRGFLGTAGPDGIPQIIPVCFTWAGDVIWTAAEPKPRSAAAAQKLAEVGGKGVSFLVDRWDEDWSRLAWLQARGKVKVMPRGPEYQKVVTALKSKYSQYQDSPLEGPVLRLDVERWLSWGA